MTDTIIVAGLTAAIVVVLVLGALAAFLERAANRSRGPREPLAKDSRDPIAEAIEQSMRRHP